VIGALRDAVLRDHLRTDLYDDPQLLTTTTTNGNDAVSKQQQQTAAFTGVSTIATLGLSRSVAGLEAGRLATAGESAAIAGRNARFFTRGGTAAARTVRFARFAGGSLAAATLLLEAKSLSNTLTQIRAGHPCEKAETLRDIAIELDQFPTTATMDGELTRYLETLTHRQRAMTEQEVQRLLLENEEILQQAQELALLQEETGSYSEFVGQKQEFVEYHCDLDQSETSTVSLIDRIKQYKIQESQSNSTSSGGDSDDNQGDRAAAAAVAAGDNHSTTVSPSLRKRIQQ